METLILNEEKIITLHKRAVCGQMFPSQLINLQQQTELVDICKRNSFAQTNWNLCY